MTQTNPENRPQVVKPLIERLPTRPTVNDWQTDSFIITHLFPRLEKFRLAAAAITLACTDDPASLAELDPRKLSLSEMGLCQALAQFPDVIPEGFEIEPEGTIEPTRTGVLGEVHPHTYLFGVENPEEIICCTFGQAPWLGSIIKPGDRLYRSQTLAPNLVTIFECGTNLQPIGILHGNRKEIARQLNLNYC